MSHPLSPREFEQLIANAPLVAIDIVAVDAEAKILVGLRRNRPAAGYWFVPGGRIYKGETIEAAFSRITESELGRPVGFPLAQLLGVYDHIYPDSVFGEHPSTHYVTLAYLVNLTRNQVSPPDDQHSAYRWVPLSDLTSSDIHPNTGAYAERLPALLEQRHRDREDQ